jgi:uncharacterized membrane protein
MDPVYVLFRIVHIGAAILWAGAAAFFFFYLEPAINKLGPAAQPFVEEVIVRRKAPIYFAATSTIAVLGGAILYYRDAGGLQLWTSTTGLIFTVGALAAIVAWIGGNALIPRGLMQVGAIAGEIQAGGGPPTAELLARLHAAQERLRMIGMIDLVLIGISIVAMESAKYVA